MKKNKLFKLTLIILTMINCASLMSQNITASTIGSGEWTIKEPFKNEVFIKNNGQFDNPSGQPVKNVQYGINNSGLNVYFTPSGLNYHVINIDVNPKYKDEKHEVFEEIEEVIRKYGKPTEELKKYFNDKSAYVNIEWEGANSNAQIVVSEKVHDTYAYPTKDEKGNGIVASAFKKLTYKNIYPNIDVEYYFPNKQGTELGVKYNIVVHPGGDLSEVKMKYSGMQRISLDNKGNIVVEIPDGNIIDHTPDFSFVGFESNQVQAKFILQGQTVSFDVPQYDKNQKLVIDPYTSVWNINPAFTTANDGYTIRVDYYKNAFVMGGGVSTGGVIPGRNYQVKKFNSAGVLQWTAIAPAANMGLYGDMVVLRTGKAIVGHAFGSTSSVFLMDPATGAVTTKTSLVEPGWRLSYNLAVNNGVLWMGGGSNNGAHLYKTDTNIVGTTAHHPWTTASNTEDISYLAQDKAGAFVYCTNAANTNTGSATAPKMVKAAVGTPGTAVWKVNEPTIMMEAGQGSFMNGGAAGFTSGWATGVNGMVVCGNRIYTYDGSTLRSYDPATGALVNTATSGGTRDKVSGIDVDDCCRVYVGVNGVIKRYSSALVFDASFNVTSDVYDLRFDPLDENFIYVTGKGFVQKLKRNSCPTCVNATKTNVSGCTLGTATVSVTDPSATAPYTYSWNTSPAQTTQSISGLSAGTYIVTVTDGASPCALTWKDTVVITGTFVPCGPTVTATGGSICPGACNNITATGASGTGPYTYSWMPGTLSGSSVSVCPTSTTTYTVVTKDGTNATASATAIVTVNSAPSPTISGTTTICAGQGTTLTSTGGGTYSWNTSATTAGITVSPTVNTSYTVTVTNGGCTGSKTVAVTVNPLPVPTISGITTICAGQSTTLTATGGGTYSWSTGDLTAAATVTPSGTSTYTVTVTNAGCTGSATVQVTVATNFIPVITGTTTICNGMSTTLSTSGGGTYSWSDGTTNASITVSPTTPTSYSVSVTNGTCSGTATVQVTVVNNPTPTITGNTSVCPGTGTTLTVNGGNTYVWDNGATTASITVSPSSQTTYTVTANTSGCTGVTTVVVTITAPPIPGITGNTAICTGGSTTLTGTGGGTYSWNTGANTTSITVSPTSTTTYTLIVTTGCSASTTVEVTVQANLTPSITGNPTICNGQSTTLNTSGGGTYAWSDGSTGPSITVSPTSNTTYSVTVTNGLCSGTASRAVTVNPNPAPTITGTTAICSGTGTTLTATSGGTYSWNTGAATAAITVSPSNNITYTVTVTTLGCTGTATIGVTVTPTPAPVIPGPMSICTGQSTTLTSSTAGPYAWNTGATTASITVSPTASTSYSVSVTVNGCTGTAKQNVIVVPPVTAMITGNSICLGESATLTAGGGTSYLWSTSETINPITVSPATTTTYSVIVAIGSCADTATYVVTVNPLPIPIASGDTTILYGQGTPLTSSGGGTYEWVPPAGLSCSKCANPTATPASTTHYCVIMKTTAGCTDSACVTVTVDLKCGFEGELFVPNGFSPNGDGQNDVLYVRGLGITEMYWAIYDRWGERVFETKDFKQGWDGTYKGKQLDPAVFVYYLTVKCITGDEMKQKGNVAIVK